MGYAEDAGKRVKVELEVPRGGPEFLSFEQGLEAARRGTPVSKINVTDEDRERIISAEAQRYAEAKHEKLGA